MDKCIISISSDQATAFEILWKDLRIAETLPPENDTPKPISSNNFDGSSITTWVIPLTATIVPIITAVLGYVVASRGEITIEKGNTKVHMKNMKPSQLADIIKILEGKNGNS